MKFYDVIIIGAGAAGLMCAVEAGKRGRSVVLLDLSKNIGEKIRISGGGRCNFTNMNISSNNFLSNNSSFCISALRRFTQHDFISLVKKEKILYHQKTLGQLFCDGSAKQIISMLLSGCERNNVKIILETKVENIEKSDKYFVVKTSKGFFSSSSLVVATGGLSIPKIGATDFGYEIARNFGLKIIQPTPALVPFILDNKILQYTKALSGISMEAVISLKKIKFQEGLLFTHRGLSGPAILQISSYWKYGDTITIDLMPEVDIFSYLKDEKQILPKQEIHNALAKLLPKKLVLFILNSQFASGRLAEINSKKLKQVANNINYWTIIPSDTEGFSKAEVTLGGVDTDEISSKSFECKKVAGLYFIGEVLDVTGHLGGYNFQWAWSSGYAAGQYV